MASGPQFGEIVEKTDLRDYWPNEEKDFSQWLSQEPNLRLLGNALDMDLVLRGVEKRVGSFEADIVAIQRNEEAVDDDIVIVENQLERTNHDHLGKLLTYAAGLREETTKSVTLVWIAKEVREEHRHAIDWLNQITDDRTDFFAVELKIWQIEKSLPAPRFHVVCQPNQRLKALTDSKHPESADAEALLDFWEAFKDSAVGVSLPLGKPKANPTMNLRLGRSGFSIRLKILRQEKKLRCSLTINHSDSHHALELLRAEKSSIESKTTPLSGWESKPSQRRQMVYIERNDSDFTNKAAWPTYFAWFKEYGQRFYDAFGSRIQHLSLHNDEDLSENDPADEV